MSQDATKILAFPIFRKYWLYHSWTEAAAHAAQSALKKDWRKGVNMEEKLSLLGQQLSNKVGPLWQAIALPIGCSMSEPPSTQAITIQDTQSCTCRIYLLYSTPELFNADS